MRATHERGYSRQQQVLNLEQLPRRVIQKTRRLGRSAATGAAAPGGIVAAELRRDLAVANGNGTGSRLAQNR